MKPIALTGVVLLALAFCEGGRLPRDPRTAAATTSDAAHTQVSILRGRHWAAVRSRVNDFLLDLFKRGALSGSKPPEALFVKCDRTTVRQEALLVIVGMSMFVAVAFTLDYTQRGLL